MHHDGVVNTVKILPPDPRVISGRPAQLLSLKYNELGPLLNPGYNFILRLTLPSFSEFVPYKSLVFLVYISRVSRDPTAKYLNLPLWPLLVKENVLLIHAI